MKKLLALLLAAMMVFTVVGCDKKGGAAIAGTYTLTGAEMNGEALPMDGAPETAVTLNADGTGTVSEGEATTACTWTQEGDTVTLVAPEQERPLVLTLEGNALVIEESGVKMTFTKQ
ncbi:MAG: hypothetical protein IKW04_01495 [Clostridia bacterium]|nr:hypothetical protein [Clostridia bacterium]